MHLNSELMFRKYALPVFASGIRVLELGPEVQPSTYRRITDAEAIWHTAELAEGHVAGAPRADLWMPDEYTIPAEDNTYDVVLSGQVLEHVRMPWRWMPELARVCRAGGAVITIVPVSWPYHEAPVDCWRIYPEGMTALSEDAGLEVVMSVAEMVEHNWWRRCAGTVRGATSPKMAAKRLLLGYGRAAIDTITIARKPASS